jgi:hypothetical protein
MKKFYAFLAFLIAGATVNGQVYSIYTAKKSGMWSDMTVWNVAARGDGVKKIKVLIPAAFTITVDNGISVVGMGDADIEVSGKINLGAGTVIPLSATSTIELRPSGKIIGTSNTQRITIGGVVKYDGSIDNTESGPSVASAATGVSPNGFLSLSTLASDLTIFQVSKNASGNLLRWITASENDEAYFEVQKSADGNSWNSLSKIAAQNLKNTTAYTYTDKVEADGICYYRLKQVDINGGYKYSPIKKVSGTEHSAAHIYVANKTLTVEMNQQMNTTCQLLISDAAGNIIARRKIPAGTQVLRQIPINGHGLIFVQLSDGNSFHQAAKFAL